MTSENKPDIEIGFKDRKKTFNVIYFEVKRSSVSSKYQEEDDYVKLLKQLKTAINFQVRHNVASPVAFGVLCEGFNCNLIQMKLVADGVYLATNIRKFKLPKDSISLLNIPRAIECFDYMMDELQELKLRYFNRDKKQHTAEYEYMKESFKTEFCLHI